MVPRIDLHLHSRKHPHFGDYNHVDPRFPIQRVIREDSSEHRDFRGYAGRIESEFSNQEMRSA